MLAIGSIVFKIKPRTVGGRGSSRSQCPVALSYCMLRTIAAALKIRVEMPIATMKTFRSMTALANTHGLLH